MTQPAASSRKPLPLLATATPVAVCLQREELLPASRLQLRGAVPDQPSAPWLIAERLQVEEEILRVQALQARARRDRSCGSVRVAAFGDDDF